MKLRLTVHEAPAAMVAPKNPAKLPPELACIFVNPHVSCTAFGVATMKPPTIAANPTPVRVMGDALGGVFGLVMVTTSFVVPPTGITAGMKTGVAVAAAMTVTVAVAELPSPASFEVTTPVTLVFTPGDVAAISRLNSHNPPPGMMSKGALITDVPGTATYGEPVQIPRSAKLLGVAIIRPFGSVSDTLTLVKVVDGFGFVIVKLSLVVLLEPNDASLKDFVMCGGSG